MKKDNFNEYRNEIKYFLYGANRKALFIQYKLSSLLLSKSYPDRWVNNIYFDNINLDIMHGLPEQTMAQGLADLEQALSYDPEHLSWYQLTIEPNTLFYKKTPKLPEEHQLEMLETSGLALLEAHTLNRYEISAFAKPQKTAVHNVNYWLFGDYFGIGAGAHGKLSTQTEIYRTRKPKQPQRSN